MWIVNKFKIMTYNVGFVRRSIWDIMTDGKLAEGDIIWLKHNYKDRYFADPFLIREDSRNYYILVEEYTFWEEIGKISLLVVDKKSYSLVARKIVIDEPWHLSFPYCKIGGEWIIPEASASGETYAYKIDDKFCVIEKEKIVDDGLIDNVYYETKKGKKWCYAGRRLIPSTELYEYKYDESVNRYLLQSDLPLQSDNRHSRGAGDFFELNGGLYRPVQDCKGRYGRQTKIMKILSIGEKGYYAQEVLTLNSFKNPPYNETMHTFNVYGDIIIVDGSKDFVRFPMKIFYKKCRRIFKWKNAMQKEF